MREKNVFIHVDISQTQNSQQSQTLTILNLTVTILIMWFFLGSLFMSKSKKGSNNKPNEMQLWSNLREGLM